MPVSRRLRRLAATLVAAIAALLLVALPSVPALAAPGTVSGGRLDWGLKQSFLTYVTGPIAKGSWGLTGGAATVGGNTFRFHSATGTYDPESGALTAAFSGGVTFKGHEANGSYGLDLKLSRFTLKAGGSGAGLYADVSSKAKDTGVVTNATQAKLVDLGLDGLDLRGRSGTLTLSNVPTVMTSSGAVAFGNFYPAGTALDPLTVSVDLKAAAAPTTAAPPATAPTTTPPPVAADTPSAPPAVSRTEFAKGALDWGVRRTFRDYVTGTIARGDWQLADGAADGGAFFRWTPAKGSYDPATGALTAAFTGAVRFRGLQTGDAYGLDLSLTNPAVQVAGGKGTLLADVTGKTTGGAAQQIQAVPLGSFDAAALKPEGGLLKATELPLLLTEDGARAFGGLYPAGTAMDPLSFAVALDPAAALPPLPDLGSTRTATPAAPVAPAPVAAVGGRGSSPWPWIAVGGGVLAAGTAVAVTRLVRRRRIV